jgi:hypothetical protein
MSGYKTPHDMANKRGKEAALEGGQVKFGQQGHGGTETAGDKEQDDGTNI